MKAKKNTKLQKFIRWALLCGFIGAMAAFILGLGISGFLNDYFNLAWENLLFKSRQELDHSVKNQPSKNIVAVVFDKETDMKLRSFWPYDRFESAKVIDFLRIAKTKAILFDVLYSSPKQDAPNSDQLLVDAAKKAGNVYLGANFINAQEYSNIENNDENLLASKFSLKTKAEKEYNNFENPILDAPFLDLMRVSRGIGCFNAPPNLDLFKYCYLYMCDNNKCMPSLSLALFTDLVGSKDLKILSSKNIELKDIKVPVKGYNQYFINWYAGTESPNFYKSVSAWKILFTYNNILAYSKKLNVSPDKIVEYWFNDDEKVKDLEFFTDPDLFKSKIIFVGVSSSGAQDTINTPFGQMPGVYAHAFALDNLINQNFINKPGIVINLLLLILLCLLTSFTVMFASSRDSFVFLAMPVFYLILFSFASLELFISNNILLNWSLPISGILISFFVTLVCYFLLEGKDKKQVKSAMSNYLSPQVLKVVMENPEQLKASASRRMPMTVFFSDIRGFTTFSENNPPEMVVKMLNEYHKNMTEIIFQNEGTLDKFIGDAVMAFWNAPVEVEDHEFKAVKSALEMMDKLEELNSIWRKVYKHTIDIGIGINSEEVVVGNIGSEKFMDYTVIGDGVNLAARLESLNKEYKTNIIISEHTYRRVKDRVEVRKLGKVTVKGKSFETEIFELTGLKDNTNMEVYYE